MSDPADELEARLRELAEAREVVTATGRRLQQRLDELGAREQTVDDRERALDERERSLDARERALKAAADAAAALRRRLEEQREEEGRVSGPEPTPPAPAPTAPAQAAPGVAGARYNVERLEKLVEANAERFPERAEDWRSYVYFLRQHASADGALPPSFDYLVDDVFRPLLER